MDYLLICSIALLVAALTFFSGFGLGTLLMPAFAVFFPLPVAIAATAVVHLANNVFKLALVGRWADRAVVIRFGIPAAVASVGGALLLRVMADVPPLVSYEFAGSVRRVTAAKVVVAAIIAVFSVLELAPRLRDLAFPRRYIPVGGLLSGFFGGLSGIQGALRAAFLIRSGLTRDGFIGTGVVCAVIIDVARVPVYAERFGALSGRMVGLVVAASVCAFVGSVVGARLVKKVTMRGLQRLVAGMLILMALAMASGVV